MKKEIILVTIILLIPTIVYAINLEIQIIQPFPNNMTGGNTYSSQFNITNNINKEVPIFFIFYINKTIPIDPAEYNLAASVDSFNLNCSQFYPGYWECWNETSYYFFPPLSQKMLNLNLSLNVATIPSSFNYTLEVDGSSLDNIPPIITLISPSNGSTIMSGTWINLTVEDNVNVGNVWYTKSIFYDTFSASGGTTTDNPWTFSDGTWSVVNGELTQNGSITQTYAFAGDTSWTDYILESKSKATSSNPGTYVGVSFRVQNDGRQYWAGIHDDNSIEVWRLDTYPGSWTQLSDWTGYTFDSSWHTIKIRAIGSNFDVYWDGNYVNSFSDNTYTSGKIGLHIAYSTYVTAQFDDVKVSSPEATLFSGSVNYAEVSVDTTSWPDGLKVLDVYANDTSNNINHTTYFFTFDSAGPNITFVYPTPFNGARGKDNWIFVNITVYDPSNVDTCTLEWNGTNESMNKIGNSICFKNKTTTDGVTYTYRVFVNDVLGNQAGSSLRTFKENARPTLDNISSNVTCVKENNPVNITTVNAFDADFDSLTLFVNSSILCNATSQPELSCVFLTSWNDTSSHIIYGSVNDSWETSEIRTLSINSDNSGPNSPTPLSPVNNSITNPIPIFSWSIPIDVGCNGLINRYRIQVHSGSSCSGGVVISKEGNITSWTFSDYSFENGTYSWKVRARDEFNNWGNWSGCMRLIIDNIPPRVENSSIPSIELGENVTASVDVWDENGVDKVILERYTDLYKFDFGMDTSPVENGYAKITTAMLKNSSNNYGWFSSPSGDRNRSTGILPINLTRDLIFDSVDRTFLINLTNGKYLITAIMGDMDYSHDNMDVYAQGQLKLNKINTSTGQIKWLNFTTNVNAGQLNITFHDNSGPDLNWICNGLIIRSLIQNYKMNKLANNTYTVVIPNPPLGIHIVLYFANDTLGNVNDTIIDSFSVTTPPPARVTSVIITPSIIFNNSIYVGRGNTLFNITFDKNMNVTIPLSVTYGNVTPYKNFTVIGNWTSTKTWSGLSNINDSIPIDNYTLNISGKDLVGNIVENTSTWFIIDTNLPRVISVILNPSIVINNQTYVKAGNITFNITFNRDMNQPINPNVTFGRYQPYNTYIINGSWSSNNRTWIGYYNITPDMPNAWYTISISGAQDLIGRTMAKDTSYKFLIDTKSPKIWDILTANITVEENETISAKVIDQTPYGQSSSGIDKVIVELNNGTNFTMQLGYVNTNYLLYYVNISNSSYGSGWQSLRFYVNDTAGNVNDTEKAVFFVNSSIPKIGGKIAFLCKDYACNDDNEPKLIAWLKSEGWNVTTNRVDRWNITELNKTDVMVCSDSGIACELGSRYTYDTYKMYMNKKMPFVEIGDTTTLRAANNFGYTKTKLGYAINNINNIYVTISDPITTGHFGSTRIFSSNKTMTTISDNLLLVKDLADAGYDNGKSTFFKSDQSGSRGRYLYVGWFNGQFSVLNELGNTTLARAISWTQCGNAKGCKV